jgi:tRNA(Ile)-lysidine synthase
MNISHSFPNGFCEPHLLSSLPADSPILIAFSGGSDSRVLLELLCRYREHYKTPLFAAHVNHGIRGEEALRDRDFCVSEAKKHGIPIFVLDADVPSIAEKNSQSLEEAAREIRYSYFSKIMSENNIPILATAHNANDNLETMLFNLARGSGIRGLCGIPPTRNLTYGKLIRPILNMSKSEILSFCEDQKLQYVTDSTNADVTYSRNRIRANIIPELCKINENLLNTASKTSLLLRDAVDFLEINTLRIINENEISNSCSLDIPKSVPRALAASLFSHMYRAAGGSRMLEYVHIESILKLVENGRQNSELSLPENISAKICAEKLVFSKSKAKEAKCEGYLIPITSEKNPVPKSNMCLLLQQNRHLKNTENRINIYKKETLAFISSDKIVGSLYMRSRREGDKLLINGMHKSIKKLMCDKKVPLELRDSLPIVCDTSLPEEDSVVFVPFLGVKDGMLSEPNEKNVVSIELIFKNLT